MIVIAFGSVAVIRLADVLLLKSSPDYSTWNSISPPWFVLAVWTQASQTHSLLATTCFSTCPGKDTLEKLAIRVMSVIGPLLLDLSSLLDFTPHSAMSAIWVALSFFVEIDPPTPSPPPPRWGGV